jgi:phosphatidylserine/phosphatidylglycerophosphate/cardiolipin synthase-like enzyme
VKLLVEPDAGIGPVVAEIKRARQTIDTTIFRFDLGEVEKALQAAVARGVKVRALVAHTNSDGEKLLRKLELRFLEHGITLARSDDDLVRYHGKMLIVDGAMLVLMAFNYTRLDVARSRSFAIVTRHARLVAEAAKLFEADMARQPYAPDLDTFVVSPENSRPVLADFIKGARQQLLIYDPKVSDRMMLRLLQERTKKGVDVRVIGKVGKRGGGAIAEKASALRLHARVIIRDGRRAFLGSQSLRQLELDARREVGLIVDDASVVKGLVSSFESDWAATKSGKERAHSDVDEDEKLQHAS